MRRQFAWSFAAQVAGLILPPLVLLALARTLQPHDFGVFALLMITVGAIQALSLSPLGEVIVKSDNDDIGDFIFTLQLILGLSLSLLLLVGAPYVAALFSEPLLTAPLRASCLILLFGPVVDTAIRLNMRRIQFKAVFVRRIVSPLCNAAISLPLALHGWGYWALVWGQVSGIAAAGAVVLAMGGWRPRFNGDFGRYADELRFSWQMLLQSLTRWVRSQSDKAVLGFNLPSSALGSYDLARRLAAIGFSAVVDPVAQVMYAVMSDRIRQGQGVGDLFMVAQRRLLLITAPLCAIMLINSEGIVGFLLGDKWLHIGTVFALMVVVGALSSTVGLNRHIFMASGRPEIMTRFMLVRAAVTLVAFLLAAPHGIYVLALAVLGLAVFFSPINIYLTLRLLGIPVRAYASKVLFRPALIGSLVAAANAVLLWLPIESLIATLLNILAGGLIMLVAGLYWERDAFRRRTV